MRRLLSILALAAILALRAVAAPSVVQTCTGSASAGTSVTCSFASATTSGDILIVSVGGGMYSAATTLSVSGCGATWTVDESDTTSFLLAHATATGGTCAPVVASTLAATDNWYVAGIEVSGLTGALDGTPAYSAPNCNGCTSIAGSSITTTVSGDFVVAALGPPADTPNTASVAAPFATLSAGGGQTAIGYLTQSAAAAISATFDFTGPTYGNMANGIVAFKSSSAPAAPTCTISLLGAGPC